VPRRWGRASRAGTLTIWRRSVAPRATASWSLLRVPAARSRLWVIAVQIAQALFEANRDQGRDHPAVRGGDSAELNHRAIRGRLAPDATTEDEVDGDADQTRALARGAREGTLHPSDLHGAASPCRTWVCSEPRSLQPSSTRRTRPSLPWVQPWTSPIVCDGEVVAAKTMSFTLSVDHRPVDGAVAAAWMREFLALIESPLSLTV
jgi:hypothetical protein